MALVRTSTKQKRGPDGKKLCKVCDSALPKGRSSYCGDECALRNNPGFIRHHVWRRDKGICAACGIDTKTVDKHGYVSHLWEADHIIPVVEGGGLCGLDGYRTLCRKCHGKESGELRKRLNARKKIETTQRETGKLF